MTSARWLAQLPDVSVAVSEFPPCDDAGLDLHDAYVANAAGTADEVLDRPELVNVVIRDCDVAGLVAKDGRVDRALLAATRLRGVSWAAGLLRDVDFDRVEGAEVSLRFSTLRRVTFRDCTIRELDLTEVTFDDVRFERCVFRGAQFHRATVKSLRIEGCDLTGCTGAEALAGASVHPDDVLNLAPSLAAALGVRVEVSPVS